MLRRDLGVETQLESGPYGTFTVVVDGEEVVDAGALAFMGVLPPLKLIKEQVAARLDRSPRSA
ncbi:MAG TPA: hypothetical protein VJ717_06580 [Gemmatimonadaceae bacterium]|nr:hypothetical protein [Gemmatimonadaceae bacterium]